MTGVAREHLQAAYMVLQKSLQQEWYFVQRTTQGLGLEFRPVNKALREEFFPVLFIEAEAHMLGHKITGFPVKHAGMVIPYPILMAQGNWATSCIVTRHLVAALFDRVEFRSSDHAQLLTYG